MLAVAMLIFAATAMRLAAVKGVWVDRPLRPDSTDYYSMGFNLHHYGVLSAQQVALVPPDQRPPLERAIPTPDAKRYPLYPMMIAPFIDEAWFDGRLSPWDNFFRIQLFQVVLGVGSVLLAVWLLAQLLPMAWALSLGFLLAISPHQIMGSVFILTEGPFAFFLLATVASLVRALQRRSPLWLGASGVLLGLTSLIRPETLFLPVALVPFVFWRWGSQMSVRRRAGLAAFFALGFVLVMSPWWLRNTWVLGSPSGGNGLANMTVVHGMYPNFMYKDDPKTWRIPYRFDPGADGFIADRAKMWAELKRRFTEETARHLRWYLIGKPLSLWQWDIVQGGGDVYVYPVLRSPYSHESVFVWTHALVKALHPGLVGLAFVFSLLVWLPVLSAGLARRLSEPVFWAMRLIGLILGFHLALHIVGASFSRYSVPFQGIAYAQALLGVYALWAVFGTGLMPSRGRVEAGSRTSGVGVGDG